MRIGDIGKNNFTWPKMPKIAEIINKKQAQQNTPQHSSISKEEENSIKDSVIFSEEGKLKEIAERKEKDESKRKEKDKLEEVADRYQELVSQLEKAREQGDAMGESMKVRMKCLLIAMRIMSGDKVPSEDYRYLAKNDLELYSKAVSMRIEKENPQKHKRLSEDEESGGKEGASDSSVGSEAKQATLSNNGEIQAQASPDSPVSPEIS